MESASKVDAAAGDAYMVRTGRGRPTKTTGPAMMTPLAEDALEEQLRHSVHRDRELAERATQDYQLFAVVVARKNSDQRKTAIKVRRDTFQPNLLSGPRHAQARTKSQKQVPVIPDQEKRKSPSAVNPKGFMMCSLTNTITNGVK